ncbi:hypothetical protein [Nocardia nova]|uniref:hypothetical protein n=1 Tax=Nocardia nova TaxID=37330 RepID=UPI000CEA62B2|nr:hypothetical protein [Nocardia nova]PPI89223.1 hypothetical protein C5E46_34450 [Nocardia nova]
MATQNYDPRDVAKALEAQMRDNLQAAADKVYRRSARQPVEVVKRLLVQEIDGIGEPQLTQMAEAISRGEQPRVR